MLIILEFDKYTKKLSLSAYRIHNIKINSLKPFRVKGIEIQTKAETVPLWGDVDKRLTKSFSCLLLQLCHARSPFIFPYTSFFVKSSVTEITVFANALLPQIMQSQYLKLVKCIIRARYFSYFFILKQ